MGRGFRLHQRVLEICCTTMRTSLTLLNCTLKNGENDTFEVFYQIKKKYGSQWPWTLDLEHNPFFVRSQTLIKVTGRAPVSPRGSTREERMGRGSEVGPLGQNLPEIRMQLDMHR